MNKCPNCEKETDLRCCPSCGTKLVEIEINEKEVRQSNSTYEYILAVIAVVGIIVMYAYRAWLGGPIFALAAYLSYKALYVDYVEGGYTSVMDFVKATLKGQEFSKILICIITIIAPLILLIALQRWIVVDTQRDVNSMMNNYYY